MHVPRRLLLLDEGRTIYKKLNEYWCWRTNETITSLAFFRYLIRMKVWIEPTMDMLDGLTSLPKGPPVYRRIARAQYQCLSEFLLCKAVHAMPFCRGSPQHQETSRSSGYYARREIDQRFQ